MNGQDHSKTYWELADIDPDKYKLMNSEKMKKYEVEQWNTLLWKKEFWTYLQIC